MPFHLGSASEPVGDGNTQLQHDRVLAAREPQLCLNLHSSKSAACEPGEDLQSKPSLIRINFRSNSSFAYLLLGEAKRAMQIVVIEHSATASGGTRLCAVDAGRD